MKLLSTHRALACLSFLAFAAPAMAQENEGSAPRIQTWKAELPGGTYEVALRAILSISSQSYIVDNAARVTEVNIATLGQFQPRFYYIEPLATNSPDSAVENGLAVARGEAEDAASKLGAGEPVWKKVVKNYPTTTHSGTIEYRMESLEDLESLFKSVERAWLNGREGSYKSKDKSDDTL